MYEALKERVFRANLELNARGLVLYTWGNVSAADREAGVAAIKPSGVPYETMRPEDMVVVSLETGEVVEGGLRPSSDWPTHRALYLAFPEAGGVTHTHSTYATAWAQAGREIPCYGTTHADYFAGPVPCTRYVSREETADYEWETGRVIAGTFAGRDPMHTPAVLVRGHGPFTWGKDAAESVYHAAVLEEVARMASVTLALVPDARELPDHILEKHFLRKHGPGAYYGQR